MSPRYPLPHPPVPELEYLLGRGISAYRIAKLIDVHINTVKAWHHGFYSPSPRNRNALAQLMAYVQEHGSDREFPRLLQSDTAPGLPDV